MKERGDRCPVPFSPDFRIDRSNAVFSISFDPSVLLSFKKRRGAHWARGQTSQISVSNPEILDRVILHGAEPLCQKQLPGKVGKVLHHPGFLPYLRKHNYVCEWYNSHAQSKSLHLRLSLEAGKAFQNSQ